MDYITKYYANLWTLEVENIPGSYTQDRDGFIGYDLAYYTLDEIFDTKQEAYQALYDHIEESIERLRQRQQKIAEHLHKGE